MFDFYRIVKQFTLCITDKRIYLFIGKKSLGLKMFHQLIARAASSLRLSRKFHPDAG